MSTKRFFSLWKNEILKELHTIILNWLKIQKNNNIRLLHISNKTKLYFLGIIDNDWILGT